MNAINVVVRWVIWCVNPEQSISFPLSLLRGSKDECDGDIKGLKADPFWKAYEFVSKPIALLEPDFVKES